MTGLARTHAVLHGERIPLDALATKTLFYMLNAFEGCDAAITADQFAITFGPRGPHSRYLPNIAPVVVSWLLDAAPSGELAAGALPWWWDKPGTWTYRRFAVWIKSEPACVTLMVRATDHPGVAIDPHAAPRPFPPPLLGPPEYLTGTHPCPHCTAIPDRYRKLSDGALVCMTCGASSREP
ncbi:MAG TPA: hypothetical protein VIV11_08645 [Kofleriaceae bacterium]